MARRPPPTGWKRWFDPQTYAFQPENGALRLAKRVVVAVLGFSVVLVGIVMIATPGPAILVIPAGLAILAVEFAWARRLLRKAKAFTRLSKQRRNKKRAAALQERSSSQSRTP
jgi:uncharacterized protein (TIGR02611 family)